MARRWTNGNDDAHTFDRLALVFAVGVLMVFWLVGYWWSEGL